MAYFRDHSNVPLPEGVHQLQELALDLRWSWNHAADSLWHQLAPETWHLTHNAWTVLQSVSQSTLDKALADADFCRRLDELLAAKRQAVEATTWFDRTHKDGGLSCVAYFSMEYMLSEALPIYSGGLGNVAGDQLKAASDLGVPVVGVGLLYQQGYFRQMIDRDGWQQTLFPYNDPSQLPIMPVRRDDGEWLRLEVKFPGYSIWLRAWHVHVGRRLLYLLDTNDPANPPMYRGITSSLYGGWHDLRLRQEMVLGIGGWRLLHTLGLRPEVCHLNEGHAAFAVLERAAEFMEETGQPFDVALAATRVGNLFTTHTAVPAGFDRFEPSLVAQFLGRYAERLKISLHDLLALGRANPNDESEPFNMAYLALRGCGAINGVSALHGRVSRHLFEPIFRRWPTSEVPIGHVTNGVHMPSWDSATSDALWTRACGKDRFRGIGCDVAKNLGSVSDAELWQARCTNRESLVDFARVRLGHQLALAGESIEDVQRAATLLDPNALTLGFARRFATYKRPDLLLRDENRLLRLLDNAQYPVQLIIAGKAHPADEGGRGMIHRWIDFIRNRARHRVIFLSDYDMLLAERLVQGVDVWINTPRRPWEASGTSGMKVLVNGGLNLSELDGWWAEAYTPDVGWAIGDGNEHGEDPGWDEHEARQVYECLEQRIIPEFYDRDADGIPRRWINRVRQSMTQLAPQYSADRAVREYTEKYYLPAANAVRARTADKGWRAAELVAWQNDLRRKWPALSFGQVRWATVNARHHVEADVHLGDIDPASVRVEVFAEATGEKSAFHQQAEPIATEGNNVTHRYTADVPADRDIGQYTLRILPSHADVLLPLEMPHILWQR